MNYIFGNWKMKLNRVQTLEWISKWNDLNKENIFENLNIFIAPSILHLEVFKNNPANQIKTCAQDVSVFEKGSHTGETGAFQVVDYVTHTIIGHSERKENFEIVAQKTDIAEKNDLTTLVCFENEAEAQKYGNLSKLIAWEDPEVIASDGVFRNLDLTSIQTKMNKMKIESPKNILIYGASVNRDNISSLAQIESIDGVLPGTASLDPVHFFDLCKAIK